MPKDNLVFVSGHASNDVGLQPEPYFCGGSNTVTPQSSPLTGGTEAPLPRRHPSSPHHIQPRYFGPNQSHAAEMSKCGGGFED